MKYIFLDIDGVLNDGIPNKPEIQTHGKYECYSVWINPQCLKNFKIFLSKIKDEYKIVLSSSWKNSEMALQVLRDNGLQISSATPNIRIPNIVKMHRGVEIEQWCKQNNIYNRSKDILIIDDDIDFMIYQQDIFLHTDGYKGFTEHDIETALEMLNREEKE